MGERGQAVQKAGRRKPGAETVMQMPGFLVR